MIKWKVLCRCVTFSAFLASNQTVSTLEMCEQPIYLQHSVIVAYMFDFTAAKSALHSGRHFFPYTHLLILFINAKLQLIKV